MAGIVLLMLYGIVTPSEAAAFGALGVALLGAVFPTLTWQALVGLLILFPGLALWLPGR